MERRKAMEDVNSYRFQHSEVRSPNTATVSSRRVAILKFESVIKCQTKINSSTIGPLSDRAICTLESSSASMNWIARERVRW